MVSLYTEGRMTTSVSCWCTCVCVCVCVLVHMCVCLNELISRLRTLYTLGEQGDRSQIREELRGSHVLSTRTEQKGVQWDSKTEFCFKIRYCKALKLHMMLQLKVTCYSLVICLKNRWSGIRFEHWRHVTQSCKQHPSCLFLTLSANHPAEEPLLLWPMVIFLTLPKFGASMVNLSSVPFSKLFLSLSSRLSPSITKQFVNSIR